MDMHMSHVDLDLGGSVHVHVVRKYILVTGSGLLLCVSSLYSLVFPCSDFCACLTPAWLLA